MRNTKDTNTAVQVYAGHRVAAFVAVCLLVASGAAHYWLTARYARASDSVPIPAGTLGQLPVEIGDWIGKDVSLSDQVIRATGTDDHVNRTYGHERTGRQVSLWLAYGVRFRDLMPHRPEVCYPGAGWTLEETRDAELKNLSGPPVSCRILKFSRGALRNERVTVVNYFLVDGRFCPDVSALRQGAWKFRSDLQYVAQVQVSCSDVISQTNAEAAASSFASESAGPIRELLAHAVAASAPLHGGGVRSGE